MPIPKPGEGESRQDFVSRCMSDDVMVEEYEDADQRMAVCSTQWEERGVSTNQKLLKAVRGRGQKRTEFGHGIQTADKYVRTMVEMEGSGVLGSHASEVAFERLLKKSARTLVYSNPDMVLEERADGTHLFKEFMEDAPDGVEVPKNTLILFRHRLTSPRKDRDGDILRTKGATVDPKMLLLWQHVHTLPLGPYLFTAEHDDEILSVVSAIVDMNELCHDAAVMVDNKMGRFSHGFRALKFDEIKENDEGGPGGFDVKEFEIMEESIVSVPSNVDAETEEVLFSLVEEGKLTSGLMKEWSRKIKDQRPTTVQGIEISVTERVGDYAKTYTLTKQGEHDEKQSRTGEQEGGEGEPAGTPEEADEGSTKAEGTEDAEVKTAVLPDGEEVEVVSEPELKEVGEEDKQTDPDGEKRGRTLSKANEDRIRDAMESIDEAAKTDGVPRPIKSMLREAAGTLKRVLDSIGDADEAAASVDVKMAMSQVLAFADPEQRRTMRESLEVLDDIHRTKQTTRELRSLLGASP